MKSGERQITDRIELPNEEKKCLEKRKIKNSYEY